MLPPTSGPASLCSLFPGVRLCQDARGRWLPPRCGNVAVEQEAVLNAARWIEPYAPLWALCLLLRAVNTGVSKQLEDRSGCVRIATLAAEEIERLHDTILKQLSQNLQSQRPPLRIQEQEPNVGSELWVDGRDATLLSSTAQPSC